MGVDKSAAVDALLAPLRVPYASTVETEDDASDAHVLDLPHASRTFKTLISGGHFDTVSKSINIIDADLSKQMAEGVWDAIRSDEAGGEENAMNVAKGNAALVLVEMISVLKSEGRGSEVKKALKGSVKEIRGGGKKGAELLATTIEAL